MLSGKDKISLQYLNGDTLYAKSIQSGSTIFEEHSKLKVKKGESFSESLKPHQINTFTWNDGFLVSGMQIINSPMSSGLPAKKVFFMNKVKFR